jgi:hypothetical protein
LTRLARILLRLYPPAWRERYRDECEALLDDHGVDARTLASVLRGAVDAHIRELAGATADRSRRVALAACLWAVAASTVSVAGFAKMVEYDDFTAAAAHHAPVAAARDVIFAGAAIVAVAVCAAGLVVALALWRDLRGEARRHLVRPLAALAAATGALALGLCLLVVFAHTATPRPPHDPRNLAVVTAWLVGSAIAAAAGLAAAGRIVVRVAIGARGLRLAIGAAWAAAAGMCLTATGLVAWGLALEAESARVLDLPDGGFLATPTVATWAVQVVLGVGGAAFALAALRRAGGASPRPQSAPSSPPSPPPAGRSSSCR